MDKDMEQVGFEEVEEMLVDGDFGLEDHSNNGVDGKCKNITMGCLVSGINTEAIIEGISREKFSPNDFLIKIPQSINKENKYDIFSSNEMYREYINSRLGVAAFLKIWPELDCTGKMCLSYQFRLDNLTQMQFGSIQRRKLFGNSYFDSLLEYRGIDMTIISGIYTTMGQLMSVIDTINTISDDSMTFQEIYIHLIRRIKQRAEEYKDEKFPTIYDSGSEYICIQSASEFKNLLNEIDSTMGFRDFLNNLSNPEEGQSMLLCGNGRKYTSHIPDGGDKWWYVIRIDEALLGGDG